VAVDERRLDEKLLIFASVGRIYCSIADAFLEYCEERLRVPIDLLIKEHFDKEVFSVMAHLDVPTCDDKVMKARLSGATARASVDHYSIVWGSLSVILNMATSVTRLVTELGLLAKVAGGQQDGTSFAIAHLGQELIRVLLVPDWAFSNAYGSILNDSSDSTFSDLIPQLGS
jgi:hypothetical protein